MVYAKYMVNNKLVGDTLFFVYYIENFAYIYMWS